MSPSMEGLRRWWDEVELEVGRSAQWRVGPLLLRLTRSAHELRVALQRGDDPLDESLDVQLPTEELSSGQEKEQNFEIRRFAHAGSDRVRLRPRSPNRPMVVKPAAPFGLPPRGEVTLYVSTAVWFELLAEGEVPLLSDFTYRPSDTWFGANTRVGELCYASRTSARLDLATLPPCPHRATTAVHIHNASKDVLWLERLKLPLTRLSVFASDEGRLWTESLELLHQRSGEPAEASLGTKPPPAAGNTRRLAEPPEAVTRGFLVDAFGGLFNRREKDDDERADRKPGSAGAADP